MEKNKDEIIEDPAFRILPDGSAGREPREPRVGEHLKHLQVGGVHYPPYAQAYDIALGQSAFFNPLCLVGEVRQDKH